MSENKKLSENTKKFETISSDDLLSDGPTAEEKKSQSVDDPRTDAAVDDIMAKESDDLLDSQQKKDFGSEKKSVLDRVKSGFSRWWNTRWLRNLTILLLILSIALLFVLPFTRYWILNAAGVRAGASLTVVDSVTNLPVRNADIFLGGQEKKTDDTGQVSFDELRLGNANLKINRRAYAKYEQRLALGWGSNPIGEVKLDPVGTQYSFMVTDFLSKEPLDGIEVRAEGGDSITNEKGEMTLTIPDPNVNEFEARLMADGYRTEMISISSSEMDVIEIEMVIDKPHVFVSNRTGRYDLYKIDIDGKNESILLEGTGFESRNMALMPAPSGEEVALMSTRTNTRSSDGSLLDNLIIVDVGNGTVSAVDNGEFMLLLGWTPSEKLVYMKQASTGAQLVSYDINTGERTSLVDSGSADAIVVGEKVMYSLFTEDDDDERGVLSINADGSNRQTVRSGGRWSNIFRQNYDTAVISLDDTWFELTIANGQLRELQGRPANLSNRLFVPSPNGKRFLWVDYRDGRGALIVHRPDTREEEVVHTAGGLGYPIRWLTDTVVVYRVETSSETADYAISMDGGEPVKIQNVTGIGTGQYSF